MWPAAPAFALAAQQPDHRQAEHDGAETEAAQAFGRHRGKQLVEPLRRLGGNRQNQAFDYEDEREKDESK